MITSQLTTLNLGGQNINGYFTTSDHPGAKPVVVQGMEGTQYFIPQLIQGGAGTSGNVTPTIIPATVPNEGFSGQNVNPNSNPKSVIGVIVISFGKADMDTSVLIGDTRGIISSVAGLTPDTTFTPLFKTSIYANTIATENLKILGGVQTAFEDMDAKKGSLRWMMETSPLLVSQIQLEQVSAPTDTGTVTAAKTLRYYSTIENQLQPLSVVPNNLQTSPVIGNSDYRAVVANYTGGNIALGVQGALTFDIKKEYEYNLYLTVIGYSNAGTLFLK